MAKRASDTKRRLLDKAQQLMMQRGYTATTVDDICAAVEVTKGAFFYYFKTKEALGLAVLEHYWQMRQHQFAAADPFEAAAPITQLHRFLDVVADVFIADKNGCVCLAGSFTQELAETQPEMRAQLVTVFDEWTAGIKPILAATNDDHSAVDQLADHIVAVIEGALILARARQDRTVIREQIEHLKTYLTLVLST